MSHFYQKSHYLRRKELLFISLFLLVLALGLVIVKYTSTIVSSDYDSLSKWLLFVIGLVFVFYFFAKTFEVKFDKYGAGIRGEKVIGKELKRLSDDYTVFHGLSMPSIGDIDYIVVGPTGVFAIEVKSHRMVDSFLFAKFSRQAKREAMVLREYIFKKTGERLWIESVLVFSRARLGMQVQNVGGVYVLQKDSLVNFINYHIEYRHGFNVDYIVEKLNQ